MGQMHLTPLPASAAFVVPPTARPPQAPHQPIHLVERPPISQTPQTLRAQPRLSDDLPERGLADEQGQRTVTQDVGPGDPTPLRGVHSCAIHAQRRPIEHPGRVNFLLLLAGLRLQVIQLLTQSSGQGLGAEPIEVPRVDAGHQRAGIGGCRVRRIQFAFHPRDALPECPQALLPGGRKRPRTGTGMAHEAIFPHARELGQGQGTLGAQGLQPGEGQPRPSARLGVQPAADSLPALQLGVARQVGARALSQGEWRRGHGTRTQGAYPGVPVAA